MAKEEKEKKDKETKEFEVKEEHECACGKDCKCKKSNIFIKLILGIVLSFVLFCGGVIVGGYILTNDNASKAPSKEEKKEEKKEETESIEEIQIGDTYKVELFDENNPKYIDLTMQPESIEYFIQSTDFLTAAWLRTAFLEGGDFLDSFKIAYIMSKFYSDEGGVLYLSTDFLNKEIQKVFSTGVDYFDVGQLYMSAVSINYVCDEFICMFDGLPGGGTGFSHPSTLIADKRKDGENTIYTIKEYDNVFDEGNSYAESNGTFLCKVSECPEDMVSVYGDKMTTYEMTFDKDSRYVSSKKIN